MMVFQNLRKVGFGLTCLAAWSCSSSDATSVADASVAPDTAVDSSLPDGAQIGSDASPGTDAPSTETGSDAPSPEDATPDVITSPQGEVGSACWTDDDCVKGATCWTIDEVGLPSGYCVVEGCEPNTCPEGSECLVFNDGVSRCLDKCATADDCRKAEGYVCDDHNVCWVGDGTVPPGGSCGADEQCAGGENAYCVKQAGFVGGYCVIVGCTDTSCPAGSECRAVFTSGEKGCVGLCGAGGSCRDGYFCVDAADSKWLNACYPGCEDTCPGDYGCRENLCVDVSHECSASNVTGDCPQGQVCDAGACKPFACHDTVLEPNETLDAAKALPSHDTAGLQVCTGDHDWFSFTPSEANTIYMLGIDSNPASGDLLLEMTDAQGKSKPLETTLVADFYHDENPVGPTNLELVSILGAPGAEPAWLHIQGPKSAQNNYGLKVLKVPYVDGASCTAAYSPQDCAAANLQGGHDPSKLLVFPMGHKADPYVGEGFLYESGLAAFGNGPYAETSRTWARRELIMAIRYALHAVQTAFPGTAPFGIGDISMPDGTTPWGHPNGTHYYGANIDVSYFIRPEFLTKDGQLAYRQICCDAPLNDWHCVDTNTSSAGYGTCIAGSDATHIVDLPRTALFLAKLASTGRLRVVGVEAKIEAGLKLAFDQLIQQGLITAAEKTAALNHIATANSHSSWVWHFNHMHVSFVAELPTKSATRSAGGFQGPWLDLSPEEQAARARAFRPIGL